MTASVEELIARRVRRFDGRRRLRPRASSSGPRPPRKPSAYFEALRRRRREREAWVLGEWQKGRSLADIARELGVSRERASQLLGRTNGRQRDLISPTAAAHLFGLSPDRVRGWIRSGQVPVQHGLVRLAEVEAALAQLLAQPRYCLECGQAFRSLRANAAMCERHLGGQPAYVNWSEGRRRHHRELVERWAAEHPELARQMQRRARLVWQLVHVQGLERATARQLARERHPDPPAATEAIAS